LERSNILAKPTDTQVQFIVSIVSIGEAFLMRQLKVKLKRNEREQNWSVKINGKSYDFISIESVKELVKDALIDAEESLLDGPQHMQ
jgi:hypothetical protein